ncbi:MAG: AEC family transporter [Eubacteriales bacterium]|nr:AEC family transporter [Eubacteriales bacterium]
MNVGIVFTSVLVMLLYMLCGFVLVKAGKAETSHARSLSGLLIYVCGPCLLISSFQSIAYSTENIIRSVTFFGVSLAVQLLFFALMWLILRKKYADARWRMLTACSFLGNVGFFGVPLVTALFPSEPLVACYSTLYITSMNFLLFTVGVYLITREKKYISVKNALLNPTTLAAAVAIPLYLLQIRFPEWLAAPVSLLGKMTTPLCMVVLGFRLASMDLRALFSQPFAYLASALKLIAFPLLAYAVVVFLPWFDTTFKLCLLVLSATPSASIVLALSEQHRCEQKLAANTLLLTTLFSLLTLPLLILILT